MHDLWPTLVVFWKKINHDWVPNLAALLAYNFLMATFPLLLLLLALVGFTLGLIDPAAYAMLLHNLSNSFPIIGGNLISAATENLRRNAGLLFIVGLISSIFLGSRAFITIEDCFSIIFRVPSRTIGQQNIMAVALLFLYIVTVPLFFLLSIVPQQAINALNQTQYNVLASWLLQISAFIGAVIVAMTLFGILYTFGPSRRQDWAHTWPGTLLAAILVVLFEKIFPIYTALILRPDNFGSIAGFAIVIIIFYYFLAFVVLLGAELNAWLAGKRIGEPEIAEMIDQMQARRLTIPTPMPSPPPETTAARTRPKRDEAP